MMPCGSVFARSPDLLSDRLSSITHDVKVKLLPSERLESFWDALWLGVQPFLRFELELSVFDYRRCKVNVLPNECLDSLWDALRFGISDCLSSITHDVKLKLLPNERLGSF